MQPHENMPPITNTGRYLGSMSKSSDDKLALCAYLPADAHTILDVGCADGAVTIEIARRFPRAQVHGIDLDGEFIQLAQERAREAGVSNASFERVYLRDLLARPTRYDAVTFMSVLHEFYSYGQGISSVFKAFADAHELLEEGGVVAIRDMIVPRYFKSVHDVGALVEKIRTREDLAAAREDVARVFGDGMLGDLRTVNHFLLKYRYTDNWPHEMQENYLAVTLDDYVDFIRLVGMELVHARPYLLPYLRDVWRQDFAFSDKELHELYSTALVVARK